jgi:hypothetical protein
MKIRDLTEARRNPNHPAQKRQSVIDKLWEYTTSENIFEIYINILPRNVFTFQIKQLFLPKIMIMRRRYLKYSTSSILSLVKMVSLLQK